MNYYIEYILPSSTKVLNSKVRGDNIDQAIAVFRLSVGIDTKVRIVNVSELKGDSDSPDAAKGYSV